MPFSRKPWGSIDKTVGAYGSAEAYCAACLIDMNEPGAEKTAEKCKLPTKEPGGPHNINGMQAAWGALVGARGGVQAPPADKKAAARKLKRLYAEADMEPPDAMKRMAG